MKLFILYLLLLSPALLFDSSAGRIEWLTDTEHDFGLLTHRQPASFIFQFRNTSDEPVSIDNVRTTCGCTKPEYSDAPVMPDSLGSILVGYDAKKQGYFRKRIKVFFSCQRKAEHLFIEGEVE